MKVFGRDSERNSKITAVQFIWQELRNGDRMKTWTYKNVKYKLL